MLIKALRCRSPVDLYAQADPVLKTLYQDEVTHRVRDIKPGDNVKSIYDRIRGPDVKFRFGKVADAWGENASGLVKARPMFEEEDKVPWNYFYNDIDELEDAILFPEEREARRLDPSEIGRIEPLSEWEKNLTIRGFVERWDSEYSDEFTDDDDEQWCSEMDEDEDEDEDDGENEDEVDYEGEDDFEGNDYADANDIVVPKDINPHDILQRMPWSTELKDVMKRLTLRDIPARPKNLTNKQMEQEFMVFLDREKAKSKQHTCL